MRMMILTLRCTPLGKKILVALYSSSKFKVNENAVATEDITDIYYTVIPSEVIKEERTNRVAIFHLRTEFPSISNHLLYKFKCSDCNASYIGKTKQHFWVPMMSDQ